MIEILFGGFRFDVKDINQQFDATKDGFPIAFKVGLIKCILATTIPQVQNQIAQKSNVVVLDVQSR